MTLGDIRTRTARVIGMNAAGTADLVLIDSWANEAIIQFLKDTKITVGKASLAITAGTSDYTIDADILAFTDLWLDGTPDQMLEPMPTSQILRSRLNDAAADGNTRFYGVQGGNLLMLYPAPATGDTLHLLYTAKPALSMTASTHDPSSASYGGIPTEYHHILESYVKWKAGEAEEHKPSQNGLQFQAEWKTSISQVRADMNRKSGVWKGRARPGRYSSRSFASPGVDRG